MLKGLSHETIIFLRQIDRLSEQFSGSQTSFLTTLRVTGDDQKSGTSFMKRVTGMIFTMQGWMVTIRRSPSREETRVIHGVSCVPAPRMSLVSGVPGWMVTTRRSTSRGETRVIHGVSCVPVPRMSLVSGVPGWMGDHEEEAQQGGDQGNPWCQLCTCA
jgi:hypothetical protein